MSLRTLGNINFTGQANEHAGTRNYNQLIAGILSLFEWFGITVIEALTVQESNDGVSI